MLLLFTLFSTTAFATDLDAEKRRTNDGRGRMLRTYDEAVVDSTPEEVWAALSDYGQVHDIAGAVYEAGYIGEPTLEMDCERYCKIEFGGRDVYVEEHVVELHEGSYYTYEVTESEGFPLKRMFVTFGVYVNDGGETVVYNITDYKLKPSVMSGPMRGQMEASNQSSVLSYKHYVETGIGNIPADELAQMYRP